MKTVRQFAVDPAKNGSRLALFGTGGGATIPASIAGEVTPLEKRPLQTAPVRLSWFSQTE